MKARKGGFTLVELLIVIMIIAILAGMMLLATGSATDSAEATKIINDLRDLKSAALLYFVEYNQWLTPGEEASLDKYYDRPLVAGDRYDAVMIGDPYVDGDGANRANIGVELSSTNGTTGIQKKLAGRAKDAGLLAADNTSNTAYSTGTEVWMNLK